MKANKRFSVSEIVTYRLSNSTKQVSIDTIDEAKNHIENERILHPRSKKFSSKIYDNQDKKVVQW